MHLKLTVTCYYALSGSRHLAPDDDTLCPESALSGWQLTLRQSDRHHPDRHERSRSWWSRPSGSPNPRALWLFQIPGQSRASI